LGTPTTRRSQSGPQSRQSRKTHAQTHNPRQSAIIAVVVAADVLEIALCSGHAGSWIRAAGSHFCAIDLRNEKGPVLPALLSCRCAVSPIRRRIIRCRTG